MTATHPSGPHVVLLATGGTISSRDRGDAGALASDTGAEVLAGAGNTFLIRFGLSMSSVRAHTC